MYLKTSYWIGLIVVSFILLIMLTTSLSAQSQEFTLMGKEYRYNNGKWYTFFQGRIGDEIIPRKIIVRRADRGQMESFDFKAINIEGVSTASRRFFNGYYVLAIDNMNDPFNIVSQLEETQIFDVLKFDAYGQNAGTPDDVHFIDQWNLHLDKLNLNKPGISLPAIVRLFWQSLTMELSTSMKI